MIRLERDLVYGETTEKRLDGKPDLAFENAAKNRKNIFLSIHCS